MDQSPGARASQTTKTRSFARQRCSPRADPTAGFPRTRRMSCGCMNRGPRRMPIRCDLFALAREWCVLPVAVRRRCADSEGDDRVAEARATIGARYVCWNHRLGFPADDDTGRRAAAWSLTRGANATPLSIDALSSRDELPKRSFVVGDASCHRQQLRAPRGRGEPWCARRSKSATRRRRHTCTRTRSAAAPRGHLGRRQRLRHARGGGTPWRAAAEWSQPTTPLPTSVPVRMRTSACFSISSG